MKLKKNRIVTVIRDGCADKIGTITKIIDLDDRYYYCPSDQLKHNTYIYIDIDVRAATDKEKKLYAKAKRKGLKTAYIELT